MKDYYAILDVEPRADFAAIKNAYRALARRWHPDANLDNLVEAENRFKDLAEAYEILGDRERRAKYDIVRPRVRVAERPRSPAPEPTTPRREEQARSPRPDLDGPPAVIGSTAQRRAQDPDLDRAYGTFAAAFDRNDEKSVVFSKFFDVFMGTEPKNS